MNFTTAPTTTSTSATASRRHAERQTPRSAPALVKLRKLGGLMALLALAASPAAQASELTTIFATNNNNSVGGMNYFDLTVAAPGGVSIQALSVNARSGDPTISLDVYVRSGSHVGNTLSAAGWTLVSSGTGLRSAEDTGSFVDIVDFLLGAGLHGVAINNRDYSALYTNGSNTYSNADMSLSSGAATNGLFGPVEFSPRTWNGTVHYAAVPEPGSLALALGALAAAGFSRRRQAAA